MIEDLSLKKIFELHQMVFEMLEQEDSNMTLLELAEMVNKTLVNKLKIQKIIKNNADRTAERG